MIDGHHGRKYVCRVAVLADVCCERMCRILASCICAVVATEAIARDVDMIEIRGQPGNRAMAIVTIVAARNMRRVLARRRNAIVARTASPKHLGVVHHEDWQEDCRAVAVLANVGCQRMRRTFAGRSSAVVAIDAIARNARMIEIGR